jgi:hypothetical protein
MWCADLYNVRPNLLHGIIIPIPVTPVDNEFIFQPLQMRKPVNQFLVMVRNAGGCGQHQTGSRA